MTGQYQVFYAPEAYNDLADIYSYLAFTLKEKRIASDQIKRIRQEVSSLHIFPERYIAVDWEPWASMGMRKMSVGRYVVYYQVDLADKIVTVIRVFYGGRDVEHIIKEQHGQID